MTHSSIKDIIQQVKDSVDIVQVIGRYVGLQEKGGKYWGLSPFKNERTPSFCVDVSHQFYYCFSTSQGGDIFNFIQEMEHIDFMEALRMLAQEVGISLPNVNIDLPTATKTDARILELNTRMANAFSYLLMNDQNSQAMLYLHERGFDDKTISLFKIGYAPNQSGWAFNFLKSKHYSEQEIAESGLFSTKYPTYSLFRHRIMFPIFSTRGRVIAYGGRILEGEGPKYINSPETKFYKKKHNLFGLYQSIESKGFKKHRKAYLVEGYLDVMAMFQGGLTNVVAPLGTAFTVEQAQQLRRLCDSIVLVFDKDDAGVQAAIKSAIVCEQLAFKSIRVVVLRENDPADVLKQYGAAALCEQVLEEEDFYTYFINLVFPGYNASVQVKEEALKRVIEYLQVVNSEYKKAMYVSQTAELFQVSVGIIDKAIKQSTHNRHYSSALAHQNSTLEHRASHAPIVKNGEIIVMAALCMLTDTDKQVVELFRTNVRIVDLEDSNARTVYQAIENEYRNGTLSASSVIHALHKELANYVHSLIISGEATLHAEALVADFMLGIKITRLKKRSKDIEYQLRVQDSKETTKSHAYQGQEEAYDIDVDIQSDVAMKESVKELLLEKKFINNEIARLIASQ